MTKPHDTQIQWVVIDLDGTLLNPDHCISAYAKRVLKRLANKGIQLVLATGRHYQDVYLLAQQLQLPIWLITSNGARVHNPQAQLIYENHLPAPLVKQILDLSQGFAVHRNIYQQDLWLVEEPNAPLLQIHHASGFGYQQVDFAQIPHHHIDKFYFNAPYANLLPLYQQLNRTLGDQLYITFTTEIYLEVMNKGVSKGQALQKLCQQNQIQLNQVMAFGDGLNDVDLLQSVGHPVCMANAHPELKQRVPQAHSTLSNAEDGVAHYLVQHFLRPQTLEALAERTKALGHPARLQILNLLTQRDSLCVCEIMRVLDYPQSFISRHLAILRDAELVNTEKHGTWVHYQLNPETRSMIDALELTHFTELQADIVRLNLPNTTCEGPQ